MLTHEGYFRRAVQGLHGQGFQRSLGNMRSDSDSLMCAYEGPNGCRCAVGWMADSPAELCEGLGVDEQTPRRLHAAGLPSDEQFLQFASAVQGAHDGNRTPHEMKQALRGIARDYGWAEDAELQELLR